MGRILVFVATTAKRNAYQVLGIHKGANDDEIKHAYVQLVKKYDPEMHTERFMVIQDAFDRLQDLEKRASEDIRTFNLLGGNYSFSKEERVDVPDAKVKQAIQALEEQSSKDPEAAKKNARKLIHAYVVRSWKYVQKKLLKEAIEDWKRVIAIDPTHHRAKNNLLCAYIRLGYAYANHTLYEEAIELWEMASQMDPDNHFIIHNLALAHEYADHGAEALRYWDETLRRWKDTLDRNPDDQYLKNCIIEAHRYQTNKSGRKPPPSKISPSTKAGAGKAPEKVEVAPSDELDRCREIIKLKPDDFDANFQVGQILLQRKQWDEAVAHLKDIQKKFPRNIEILNALGWAQLNNQDVDVAFRTWRRGLKLDPKNFSLREALVKGHMFMGRALREKNLFINALVHFKELSKYLPDNDEVHFELGRTYQMKGDARPSYLEYQKALKLNPKHRQARINMSDLKMRR